MQPRNLRPCLWLPLVHTIRAFLEHNRQAKIGDLGYDEVRSLLEAEDQYVSAGQVGMHDTLCLKKWQGSGNLTCAMKPVQVGGDHLSRQTCYVECVIGVGLVCFAFTFDSVARIMIVSILFVMCFVFPCDSIAILFIIRLVLCLMLYRCLVCLFRAFTG